MATDTYDVLNKVVFIGDSGVGKSVLVNKISGDEFSENHIPTIGIDFRALNRTFGDVKAKLQIWDSAGQERFRTITESYYRGAHGIVVVYDVGSRASFDSVHRWMREAEAGGCRVRFLVANKAELAEPAVPLEEGERLAGELGVPFASCSARTGEGLEELLETIFHGMQPKPPVVLTVTASRLDGRLRLSCLRVSGAEAGFVEVDEVDRPCCSLLPELRRACGLMAHEPAHFVTVAGAQLPETPYVYLPELEEVCVALRRESLDAEPSKRLVEAAFVERGLHREDVEGEPKITGPDGDFERRLFSVKRRQELSIDAVFPSA